MLGTWTAILPWVPASSNRRGIHWAVVKRRNADADRVVALWRTMTGAPPATGPRHVSIVRYGRGLLDDDNLAHTYKQLRDALVRALLITGDAPRDGNRFAYAQERIPRRAQPSTLLVLADLAAVSREQARGER